MISIRDVAAELRAQHPAMRPVAPLPCNGTFDPMRPTEEFARLAADWKIRKPADPSTPGLVRVRSVGTCLAPLTAKFRLFDPEMQAGDGDLVIVEMFGMFLRNMARARPRMLERYPDGVPNVCTKLLVHGIDGELYVANRTEAFRLSLFGTVLGVCRAIEDA
jgi:hypothetical protein